MYTTTQGDAIHAFPPDLGAGVNSAFEDVMDFIFSLDRADGAYDRCTYTSNLLAIAPPTTSSEPRIQPYNQSSGPHTTPTGNWGEALPYYEHLRAPQSKAICKLIPIGFPHQVGTTSGTHAFEMEA